MLMSMNKPILQYFPANFQQAAQCEVGRGESEGEGGGIITGKRV